MHVEVSILGLLTSPAWKSQGTHELSIPLSTEIGQVLIIHFEMESYTLVPMKIKEQFELLKYTSTSDPRKDTKN